MVKLVRWVMPVCGCVSGRQGNLWTPILKRPNSDCAVEQVPPVGDRRHMTRKRHWAIFGKRLF
jgi:hypothetical protein